MGLIINTTCAKHKFRNFDSRISDATAAAEDNEADEAGVEEEEVDTPHGAMT